MTRALASADVLILLHGLALPVGEYVVVGGAGLAARGVRTTTDIDLVVSQELFRTLAGRGWQAKTAPDGKPGLRHGPVEVYLDVNCGDFAPSFEHLRDSAEMIDGIPFIGLKTLRQFKLRYGRDKDRHDLKLINRLLAPAP